MKVNFLSTYLLGEIKFFAIGLGGACEIVEIPLKALPERQEVSTN